MIGRMYPTTIGTRVKIDCETQTARRTPSRSESRATAATTSLETGESPRRRNLRTVNQLTSGRNENASTPAHQIATIVINLGWSFAISDSRQLRELAVDPSVIRVGAGAGGCISIVAAAS